MSSADLIDQLRLFSFVKVLLPCNLTDTEHGVKHYFHPTRPIDGTGRRLQGKSTAPTVVCPRCKCGSLSNRSVFGGKLPIKCKQNDTCRGP